MIIERKYVPFSVLFNRDKEAWAIFESAFNKSYSQEERDRIAASLLPLCLYQREMSWCFRFLNEVIEGFERLDKEKPYDNGLSYKDVNETQIVSSGDEGLVIHLICKFDGINNIVQILELKD